MESIKFMTVDMAKALSERLIHAPKTKQHEYYPMAACYYIRFLIPIQQLLDNL